ncbi:MAG: hypothetical protein HYT98_02345 [Candidatus Sungbacteria bacterium]|nr:hypothetical protein [Candidatus Sungbacteria bacterium]
MNKIISNQETKICQNCKNEFTIESVDFAFYEKIRVPPPTWCPECRMVRRMVFRNERKLFRIKSAKSGKEILSLNPPEAGVAVYDEKEWWSDDWDAREYGREYDFSRPFFDQFFELSRVVPRYSRDVLNMVNSDYSANAADLKNCYLLFNSNYSEDSSYGNAVDKSHFCFDNSHIQKCERCYESFWLANCYQTHFSSKCEDCQSVWFSKNLRGCSNCFGCVNLRGKNYCIFNKQYSKEDYIKKLESFSLHTFSGITAVKKTALDFWLKFPNKYIEGVKNLNSSGEYVTHSKNVHHGYLVREGEDLRYVQYVQLPPSKDLMDITVGGNGMELSYENATSGWGRVYNLKFCAECWPEVRDMEYSMFCTSSSNLFGCVGLHKKEFCILNRQYTKESFDQLKIKIIKHMDEMPYVDSRGRAYKYGEFFPPELSPFAYNQTIAIEHFPLTKEEAEKAGYRWQEPTRREYEITMTVDEIPDSIRDIREDILKEVIQCASCKRAYRLIRSELEFLKKEGIPAPRVCIDCRHDERISQRNKAIFYSRRCACSGQNSGNGAYKNTATHFHGPNQCLNEFKTSYAPDRPEIVYCEACYNSEVV